MRTTSPLHAVTWLLWAVAAAGCVQLAPSPVYVALTTAIAFLVVSAHRLDGSLARAFPILVTLGVVFAVVRVVLTALTTHTVAPGTESDDIWFTLPQVTLPRIVGGFTVGGPIEGTVVLQSAAQAFAVVGVLAAFGAFNAVASHHELVQAAPRAFHEPGLIVTVALAFVPSTMTAVTATREADRARTGGRVVRRGRLVRLTVPILESGLERAMALAESMDARGFARLERSRADRVAGWLGMGSLLALGGSFVALVGRSSGWALVAAGVGTVGLVGAVLVSSRGSRTTRYRPRRATRADVAVSLVALAAPAGMAALAALGDDTLVWTAFPLRFPAVALGPLLCLALLAVPVLVPPVPTGAADHEAPDAAGRRRDAASELACMSDHPGGVSWRATTFAYPGGPIRLGPIDLAVEPGTVVLVVGDSGSGKSTLLRTVNGLVPHSSGGAFGGDVVVGGRSTTRHRPRDLADVVGFVHQTPEAQFVVDHVEHDIAFVLENLGTDARAMRRRVEEALDALAVAHLRDRSPATLSGGERQRCAIAGALAAAPSVLVLDEPTSMLDPQGADDVLAALGRLNDDLGTTVVVAEHRLERAGPLADRALVLAAGLVADDGPPAAVIATLTGAPPVTHLGRLLGWDPPPLTVRDARTALRATGGPPPWATAPAPPTDPAPPPAPGEVLVEVSRASVAHGPRTVLGGVDLDVRRGEVVAVLGRNGSGKTSLLRLLAGAHQPSAGSVDARVPVAYVPQEPDSLLYSSTVRAEVEATLALLGRRDPAAVDRWLDALGLHDLADRHPRSLSVGQRQRVAIAAVAVGDAPVLVLDEPTRGIDAASRHALEQALLAHRDGGGAVVLATHDVELAARVASRVVVLGDGDVVADGPARDVLAGSLFAPQVLRVLPPFLTVDEVAAARSSAEIAP